MPPVYVIAQIRVKDQALFEQYRSKVVSLIPKYGGRYLVRGGAFETIEGSWAPARLTILEFPSKEAWNQFYGSSDYAPLLEIRKRSADSIVTVIDGYAG